MLNILRGISGILLLFAFLITTGCKDSTKPDTGSVSGRITFTGTWPTTLNEVQVSIYQTLDANFIPTGPPDAFSEPIAMGSTSYNFSLEGLDKATYTAVYVSARNPSNAAATQLIGMYWQFPDSVGVVQIPIGGGQFVNAPAPPGPTAVTISDNSIDVTGVNVTANLSLAP